MRISPTEHEAIFDAVDTFLSRLEELGVTSAVLSTSCCIEGIGWMVDHFRCGDPMAANGLHNDALERGDDDDGDFVFLSGPDEGPGDGWKESVPE